MVDAPKQTHGTDEYNMLELARSGVFPNNSPSKRPQHDKSVEDHMFDRKNNGDAFCERIRQQVGISSAYYVNVMGISGGITLWRINDVRVTVKAVTQNIIDCAVKMSDQPNPILITWVYVDAYLQRRKQN